MEHPIIERIEKQECVGYKEVRNGFASIIKNHGVDKSGKRWTWKRDSVSHRDGTMSMSPDYEWQEGYR